MLTQKRLKEVLHYDPVTGEFTRVERTIRTPVGTKIRGLSGHGYYQARIDGSVYVLHRLAFLYVTWDFPVNCVDHINGVKCDNRWVNLRDVTKADNSKNQATPVTNTSGVVGVYWDKGTNKWRVKMKVNGVHLHLGLYADKGEAIAARKSGEVKYGYHANHGRVSHSNV